ncbi:radical SAM/SPASM domain-containing protein, partial [Bacteroidota bacterium]
TFAGGRFASLCRPTWISFLLTERCNARCVHCDIWQSRGQEDSPTREEWEAALTDLRRWLGPAHVCLTGGEALLNPYAIDLVEHGSRLGLLIEFLTNGFWEDQARIERLALARPWRVTLSLDGLGETHDRVRGKAGFFERTSQTIDTLVRMRDEKRLDYSIRFKTVIMSHNLDGLEEVTRFATQDGMDVLFQPVEQNYNAEDDPEWYLKSENWPRDSKQAVAAVDGLIRLKNEGCAIANSVASLEVIKDYFRDPAASMVATQAHTAHEKKPTCSSLSLVQVQANGDVKTCSSMPPIGTIRTESIREIWKKRPKWWISGCCMESRMSAAEKEARHASSTSTE